MLFFYAEKLDPERLRHTLAQVLDDFPSYAGKLLASAVSLQILHGAAPALFEVSERPDSLALLLSELRIKGRCRELEPQVTMLAIALSRAPTLLVRLTQVRDGCVLGVGWNHAVGDMHSTMLLMRAWADAYAGRAYHKPILVSDRDAYLRAVLPNPSTARSVARRTDLRTSIGERLALFRPATRVRSEFSDVELSALQKNLCATQQNVRITRNDALCAHVYAVLRRLSLAPQQTRLCLVVNFRKRLGLPEQVVGNMTSLLCQPVRKHHTASQIAAGLRKRVNQYADRHVYYHPTARVYRACSRSSQRIRVVSRQFKPGSGDLFITNWDNFGAYGLCFGSSAPVLFHPIVLGTAQLPQWFMIVYELPREQGLAISMGLPKAVAKRWSSAEGQALLHDVRPAPGPTRSGQANALHDGRAAPVS